MSNKNYLSIYAKSFNWAGFFLPKKIYLKCSSLYDFCRTVDNIADGNEILENKRKKFLDFKRSFNNKSFNDDVIKNMWDLIVEFNISKKIVDDLFDGVESDLREKVKFNSQKDLLIYSYRVAGTVGLMMAKILSVKNVSALKSAIDLGIAMQLTNISRDVVEDANNNRFYISSDFSSIKETIKLADQFYESSFSSIKKIPISFRFAILVARRVYRKIGYNILKKKSIENYTSSGKIYVSNMSKIFQTFLSIYDFIFLLLIKSNDHSKQKEHLIINDEINLNERF
ncbi:MAG: phytoene/squalene synthase family protein [Candidatus Pelagibacter sp.]